MHSSKDTLDAIIVTVKLIIAIVSFVKTFS